MLYHLLFPFHTQLSVLNVMRYITFRTAAASLSALAISLAFGPWMIRKLREFQIGQVIRQEGPTTHRPKAGTPTMGGLLILTAALVPTLLWAESDQRLRLDCDADARPASAAIGFLDDYLKIVRRSHHGLRPRLQDRLPDPGRQRRSASCCSCSQQRGLYNTRLVFPFFKSLIPDLGWWYLPFAVFVLIAESNAVNLTDGLDGLAISVFAIAAAAYTALAYVVGQPRAGRLPAARSLPAGGGADGILRLARRRLARVPLVQLVSRRDFHGRRRDRWRSAPRSAPSRS